MVDKDKVLDEIFNNDPFGLLAIKPKTSNVKSTDERLNASFEEINSFVESNNRPPEPNPANISEYQLYSRLKNLREDEDKMLALEPLDKYGLLNIEKKEINSIDDIFDDDLLGIFDDGEAQSLFEFKHTPREIARAEADFVARRKPCKNFKEYEELFHSVQIELSSGKRKLAEFKQKNLRAGDFYVHRGVLLYLKSVDFKEDKQQFQSGERNRIDGRTICVFENGTESNMLYRSLYKILLANGKAVTENSDRVQEEFYENFSSITEDDKEDGYIYVVRSLSADPKIREIDNLFKIGYSTTPVSDRLKNAEKEATYLMAPVHLEAEYKTFNMNTQKFEQLLHNFFGESCLNIDIYDQKLRRKMPQEWFIAPLNVIDEAIDLLVSGSIIHYKYDKELGVIILKDDLPKSTQS
jgi:hypothetical protein